MVSPYYRQYKRIIHWPELKAAREAAHLKWHIDEPVLTCLANSRAPVISGQRAIFRIWVPRSLDMNGLYLLDAHGNEIPAHEVCEACAANVMKLLRWWNSDEGHLETEQQELRSDSEENDLRAKGIFE